MSLLNKYRAFVINSKINKKKLPEIEEIIESELYIGKSIKREDLVRNVEFKINSILGSKISDDSIGQIVSSHLEKLKKQGKVDNPSRGIWKAI